MKKVYTRFFIYLTCCVLVLSFVVAPASASTLSEEAYMHNYFDYNTGGMFYRVTSTDKNLTFPLHQKLYVRYVELYVASAQGISSVSLTRGSVTDSLTVLNVGNGYYKIYGGVAGGNKAWDDKLTFTFNVTQATDIQIWSFRYSLNKGDRYPDVGTLWLDRHSDSTVTRVNMKSTTDMAMALIEPEDFDDSYTATFFTSNWKKYDYVDFLIALNCDGVQSISCDLNGRYVPHEVTYINNIERDESLFNVTFILVRMDVSGIVKTSSNTPTVDVTLYSRAYSADSYVALSQVVGTIKVDNQSSESTWFQRLIDTIKDVFNPDDDKSSETGKEMENAADELNQGANAFDNIATPDINASDLTGDYTKFSPSGLTVLSVITSNPYVTSLLVLVFTFALCAYIFFGKRR